MKIKPFASLGKYRDLLFAITLFLVLELGVLVFNFQSSRLIEADTRRIDLAGDKAAVAMLGLIFTAKKTPPIQQFFVCGFNMPRRDKD